MDKDRKLKLYTFGGGKLNNKYKNLDIVKVETERDIAKDVYNNISQYYLNFLILKDNKIYLKNILNDKNEEINENEIPYLFDDFVIRKKNKIVEFKIDPSSNYGHIIEKEDEKNIYIIVKSLKSLNHIYTLNNNHVIAVWEKFGEKYKVYKIDDDPSNNKYKILNKKILIISNKHFDLLS